jgi:hypothetical protein
VDVVHVTKFAQVTRLMSGAALFALACMFAESQLRRPAAAGSGAAGGISVTVQRLTSGPKNHLFGYIGHALTIPWNASGRYIVALRTDFYRRMPKPGETADVVLIDTQDGNRVTLVDRTHAWNLQQGTMLYWNPDAAEAQFFFNDLDPETGAVFTVLFDIAKRSRVREYRYGNQSIANGGVAPGGKYFLGINYGKISRSREVISYAGAYDWTSDGPANPNDDGLFRIDIATGRRELLVSYQRLAEFLRVADADTYPTYVHHTIWNRDSDRILFIVRGRGDFRPNAWCVIRPDGAGLTRTRADGHPEWAEGKRLSLMAKGFFELLDVDRQEVVGRIGKPGVFPNTWEDNAMSPNGEWYVGSHKGADAATGKTGGIYTVYRIADGKYVRSPAVPGVGGSGATRIDPAPRWNRTSDAILTPGVADDGTRQLFLIRVQARAAAGL